MIFFCLFFLSILVFGIVCIFLERLTNFLYMLRCEVYVSRYLV